MQGLGGSGAVREMLIIRRSTAGVHKSRAPDGPDDAFCPVAPTFGSSVRNLLHISPQAPRRLRWLLYTLKIMNF